MSNSLILEELEIYPYCDSCFAEYETQERLDELIYCNSTASSDIYRCEACGEPKVYVGKGKSVKVEKEESVKERAPEISDGVKLAGSTPRKQQDDISVEEFSKILSSKFSVIVGKTMVSMILMEMDLITRNSNKPTQKGQLIYLRYKKHGNIYSTRVLVSKAGKLSKYMFKFLVENQEINEALGNPFDI